jgi:CheY-like chemotaxis protein
MPLKIFVADDSVTIQKIVSLTFNDEDAIVESVRSGEIALDSLKTFKPDVALVDVFMPGCSGYEICERIKEDPELSSIPVILLVGTFEPFDEAEAYRVKSDSYLTKPFDTAELLQTVHSLVEKRTAAIKSDVSMETPLMDTQINAVSSPELNYAAVRNPVSPQVKDSFLGSGRILDLFDGEVLNVAEPSQAEAEHPPAATKSVQSSGGRFADLATDMPEDLLNLIVDRVMRRMSAEIIREVAWEVVPELSESIIRRTIEEQKGS